MMSKRPRPADDTAEEWPEPNPSPHLTPFRTAAAAVDEVFLFDARELLATVAAIAAVEAWFVTTGEPAASALANGTLAFAIILAVGAVGSRIERGQL